jgi:hypothetical protein
VCAFVNHKFHSIFLFACCCNTFYTFFLLLIKSCVKRVAGVNNKKCQIYMSVAKSPVDDDNCSIVTMPILISVTLKKSKFLTIVAEVNLLIYLIFLFVESERGKTFGIFLNSVAYVFRFPQKLKHTKNTRF